MKISEVLNKTDNLLPNAFDEEQKLEWLKQIENKIYKEVVLTHKNQVPETVFDEEKENDLIAPFPYDNLYISFLIAQIYKYLNETVRYNNAMVIFNQEYQEFTNYYNRQNMPLIKES